MLRSTVRLGVVLLLVFVLGCSSRSKPGIVGKWQGATGSVVEFRADGTVAMQRDGQTRQARYRMPNAKQIEFLPADREEVYDRWEVISLDATSLTARNSKGSEQSLTRVK
jgi:hypothetical protein